MSVPASLDSDRAHLLHPLHHPSAYASTRIWVSGDGALIKDANGREYIDGLSGLWNVNVGHGRRELADAAQRQMSTLAFHSTYAGGSNEPAIALAERLSALVYPSINTFFFTSGGAKPLRRRSRPRGSTGRRSASPRRSRSSRGTGLITGSRSPR